MTENARILDALAEVIADKAQQSPEESYTAQLLVAGQAQILRKFGEEALEVVLAASTSATPKPDIIAESADLLYHLLVLWQQASVSPEAVWNELARRQRLSGLAEKTARSKKTF
ncbi:MAG: phosphoribosyl-ATP diphosphatase [Alphaproteobacteria bacterium]|nr:phosphoribosyl-ATP diphosphatase [Alphaproteobacteria bacterium]